MARSASANPAVEQVIRYIQDQAQHHRKISFQDEFLSLLRKHGIAFDEQYIWQ